MRLGWGWDRIFYSINVVVRDRIFYSINVVVQIQVIVIFKWGSRKLLWEGKYKSSVASSKSLWDSVHPAEGWVGSGELYIGNSGQNYI